MPRTQKQIIDAVGKELKLSVRVGRRFYERLIAEFTKELIKQGRVEMAGLGVFGVNLRPEHQTTHPKTGQKITIPAKKAVRYRSSRDLRRRLNPKTEAPPVMDPKEPNALSRRKKPTTG
jgi:nucleoid DNA-binding protein